MKQIYYISPVGADSDYASKRRVLDELASSCGVRFHFPLDHGGLPSIEPVLKDLRASQLVIADLSLERPSCYFEVGLAQAVGSHIALIAATGTAIHQVGETAEVSTYEGLDSYRQVVEQALSKLHQQ